MLPAGPEALGPRALWHLGRRSEAWSSAAATATTIPVVVAVAPGATLAAIAAVASACATITASITVVAPPATTVAVAVAPFAAFTAGACFDNGDELLVTSQDFETVVSVAALTA